MGLYPRGYEEFRHRVTMFMLSLCSYVCCHQPRSRGGRQVRRFARLPFLWHLPLGSSTFIVLCLECLHSSNSLNEQPAEHLAWLYVVVIFSFILFGGNPYCTGTLLVVLISCCYHMEVVCAM